MLNSENQISKHNIMLEASNNWQEIPLDAQFLECDAKYQVELRKKLHSQLLYRKKIRLSRTFEVLKEQSKIPLLISCDGDSTKDLPHLLDQKEDFWLMNILFEGLWSFEDINFQLGIPSPEDKPSEQFSFIQSADVNGQLKLSLDGFMGELPESSTYCLTFQRLGEPQQLICVVNQLKN